MKAKIDFKNITTEDFNRLDLSAEELFWVKLEWDIIERAKKLLHDPSGHTQGVTASGVRFAEDISVCGGTPLREYGRLVVTTRLYTAHDAEDFFKTREALRELSEDLQMRKNTVCGVVENEIYVSSIVEMGNELPDSFYSEISNAVSIVRKNCKNWKENKEALQRARKAPTNPFKKFLKECTTKNIEDLRMAFKSRLNGRGNHPLHFRTEISFCNIGRFVVLFDECGRLLSTSDNWQEKCKELHLTKKGFSELYRYTMNYLTQVYYREYDKYISRPEVKNAFTDENGLCQECTRSRYNDLYIFREVEKNKWKADYGTSPGGLRVIFEEGASVGDYDKIHAIDPSGGPMMCVGGRFLEKNLVIEKIGFEEDGTYIYTKIDNNF